MRPRASTSSGCDRAISAAERAITRRISSNSSTLAFLMRIGLP
jgi:hypothetical protein